MGTMGDSMDFLITLDQFEGPLDLMLHLIKENKLDLFDLDMNILNIFMPCKICIWKWPVSIYRN